jgi:hypothetical protein
MSNPTLYAYSDKKQTQEQPIDIPSGGGAVTIPSSVIIEPALFTYYRLPAALLVDSSSSLHNAVNMSPKFFNGSMDSVDAFVYYPLKNSGLLSLCTDTSLQKWGITGYESSGNGLFGTETSPGGGTDPVFDANAANAGDQDPTTYHGLSASWVDSAHYNTSGIGIVITPDMSFINNPNPAINIDFDNLYLGAYITHNLTMSVAGSSALLIKTRPFFGNAADLNSILYASGASFNIISPGLFTINDLPDEYYASNIPATGDTQFLNTAISTTRALLSGYKNLQSTADSKLMKSALSQLLLFIAISPAYSGSPIDISVVVKFYELAWILEKSVTIKEAVYSPLSGRTFKGPGDSGYGTDEGLMYWNARRLDGMIADPADMLEHLKRLQNWSECAVEPVTAGKVYDPAALIKTGSGADGSFDNVAALGASGSTTFGDIRACRPAFQIFEDSKGWTESLSKQFCKTFGMLSYIDSQGYECVESFTKRWTDNAAPSDPVNQGIAFSELAERPGEVIEPQIQDVFCEPAVEYAYDAGPDKYQSFLAVTNTSMATWQASYTPGFDNTTVPGHFSYGGYDPFGILGSGSVPDGQYIWTVCRLLYQKYGQVEKCPSDFSECPLIATDADALYYLVYKLKCMQYRRITLTVFYDKARYWHFGQHIKIQVPFLTQQSPAPWWECVIEKIQIAKNQGPAGRVKLGLIILDSVS